MLSVIIPVHNVEKYLPGLLKVLINQDLDETEVIFVDDGSTDGSARLLDEISHDHFVVMHQDNQGVASARNAAVAVAKGEYLCFIDPDDSISEGYLQGIKKTARATHADVLICDWWKNEEGNYTPVALEPYLPQVAITGEWVIKTILSTDLILGSLWAKAFSAKLFSAVPFPIQRTCSDFVPCLHAICEAKTVQYIPGIHYSYTVSRKGSLQNSQTEQDVADSVNVHRTVAQFVGRTYPQLRPLLRLDILRAQEQACIHAVTSVNIAQGNKKNVFGFFHRGMPGGLPLVWRSSSTLKHKIMYTLVTFGFYCTKFTLFVKK